MSFFQRCSGSILLLSVCLLCMADMALLAQPVLPVTVWDDNKWHGSEVPKVLIRSDTGNLLTPQQAWAMFEAGQFKAFTDSLLPGKFEYERYTFWAVFALENRTDSLLDLLVQIDHYRDTIWKVRHGVLTPVAYVPKLFPVSLARPLLPYHVRTLSCLQFSPLDRDTLLVKIRHYRPMRSFLPVLYEPAVYEQVRIYSNQYSNVFYFLLFGVLFTVFLYCIAQFFHQHDAIYLWFSLYLISLLLVTWRNIETENPWLYSTFYLAPWFWTKTLFSSAHFCFYTLFVYRFLQRKGKSEIFTHQTLRGIWGGCLIAAVLDGMLLLFDALHESWLLYYANRMLLTIFSLWFLWKLWRNRKGMLTRIVLVATFTALLGELISLFLKQPASIIVSGMGILLQIALLSIALAYRSYEFQKEYQHLQRRHIRQLEENARLSVIERREEIESFKNRFYANITHEFRTPLTIIMGMAHALQNHSDPQVRSNMTVLIRNSHNLLDLVNKLLRLSKVESDVLQLHAENADVMQFVKITSQSFESLASLKSQRLEVTVAPEHFLMDFDADFLQQILSNLIGNALKYTGAEGIIQVKGYVQSSSPRPGLVIEVRDTGQGISENELPYIFDRFRRGENDAHLQDGIGLGLALVKELVNYMEGTIHVESVVGKGSLFRVIIPARNTHIHTENTGQGIGGGEQQHLPLPFVPQSSEELPVLLLVEDNKDMVEYLSTILQADYQILYASDGEAGFEEALQQLPDIVLSDLMMPVLDGFGLCKKLKNDHRTSHIPIVMLTARASVEDKINGLKTGVDAWLTKPFHKEEMLSTLTALLESRRRLRALFETGNFDLQPEMPFWVEKEKVFLERLNACIEAHLGDPDYDVPKLSRDMAMSRVQLHRKLKSLGEPPPSLFIRAYRLSRAKIMLKSSDDTVAQIAYQTGFNDPAYFSNCFKETFGASPSEWRKGNLHMF